MEENHCFLRVSDPHDPLLTTCSVECIKPKSKHRSTIMNYKLLPFRLHLAIHSESQSNNVVETPKTRKNKRNMQI